MPDQTYTATHLRKEYSGFMDLDVWQAHVTRGETTVTMEREVHDHGHGAAVLPYDPERRTALLVRQLRLPVHAAQGDGLLLEAAAGLIDPGDVDPAAAARREAAEELRYMVREVSPVGMCYMIPGMVTEQMHCFLAQYGPGDRVTEGFEADADEVIEVEEWPLADLWQAWRDGRLHDGKAVLCLMALRLERPELFD